ncbi:type II secretion system secretin GspD [Geobacter sp. DSM 9736]|uniref:type II secretion system secretin GspD n=1 Tax=Geobacter sp. DSM 9736 TaxID=1277350 RepID=UPI0035124A3D
MRVAAIVLSLLVCITSAPAHAVSKGVVLNFNEVDISTMVKFISDLTGRNFIMDDRVKGKISVFSPAKLSLDDAFNVFTSVLELKGFTVIQAGRVYKIVPTAAARQSGTKILTDRERGPVNDSYVARVITLDNISAADAVTFLQPVVSKDGYISAFGPGNMILLVDSALNTNKVLSILNLIDGDQPRQGPELVFLKNATAETVANVVRDWIGGKAVGKGQGQAGGAAASAGTGVLVVPDTRLNALIIFGSDRDKGDIKQLISMLDVVPPTTSSKVNVYYLENADATEVAKVLDGVVKGSAAQAQQGQPGQAAPPQQSPFEGGKITITPDKATNSLVIMASPNDYQNLSQVIQKLDKRRRQVFVQAMIAEISLNKLKDLGLQWGMVGAATDGEYASVFGQYDPQGVLTSVLQTIASANSVVSFPQVETPANFAAILRALETNGAVNVLSTPNILTSDNKEAEIFVGENVPFRGNVTVSTTSTLQSIERKDTGISLKLTPQISEGEYVKLDLYQEISAVNPTTTTGAADLITTKRSAKTSVVVKDNEMVVIGGLIQDRERESISKVPLLGDIPLLGYLFKYKNFTRDKTNLMIVLTPRIIRSAAEMAEVSNIQREKFNKAAIATDAPFSLGTELQNISAPPAR